MGKKRDKVASTRLEEVQDIIERMPTYWVKWIALCTSALVGAILLLSFLIRYPDTIDGRISITASIAPVRLVAHTSGRLHLLKENHQHLEAGTVIGYIESGANYQHILLVDSLLKSLMSGSEVQFPDSLILGEIGSAYNGFVLAYLQYLRIEESKSYVIMQQTQREKIYTDALIIANIAKELELRERVLKMSYDQLQKDSILVEVHGLSQVEYKQKESAYLDQLESQVGLRSSMLMKQSEFSRGHIDLQRMQIEESQVKEEACANYLARRSELSSILAQWQERYLQRVPIDGDLEYLGFWRENAFVQSGQELFSILPKHGQIIGEVMIPSFGAGKVKLGQTANVKVSNFPSDEYGILKGKVQSISRLSSRLRISNDETEAYQVLITFPEGPKTNFGQILPLDFESKGTVEIITKPKRLIERIFDNLKAKSEK
ncbi:HlyD family efflux transporter periplasmic adaptor subunit [Porphyromonas catoniae]|uniref:HlyD family efflux transporter periplasmic adaptor subunit n=1 Tax=Porphyromonas catoniae TaxID=41976 RepID=UPI0023F46FB8|nr:HlyD family efflux transporter periplasmic adaptor subunit [Porphyromonas catoniae]